MKTLKPQITQCSARAHTFVVPSVHLHPALPCHRTLSSAGRVLSTSCVTIPHPGYLTWPTRHLLPPPQSKASDAAVATEHWWKKDAELWVEVHDMEAFKREVLQSPRPVIVDWFASWCTGCQRSYPEICKIMKNSPELTAGFKLVKVCVDDMKAFSREQGVTALPRMSLYRPGQGRALTWDIPLSRVKHLKKNLLTVLANPQSNLAMDPNNFIVATGAAPSPEEIKKAEAAKAEAVAALNQTTTSLFSQLKAVANGQSRTTTPPTPVTSNGSTAATNGSSAAMTPVLPSRAPIPPPAGVLAPAPATGAAGGGAADTGATAGVSFGAGAGGAAANGAANGTAVASGTPGIGSGLLGDLVPLTREEYLASFKDQFGHSWSLERQMFLNWAGEEYGYDGRIESLYPREVGVRMAPLGPNQRQQHYLDYTGSGVYCTSQLEAAFKELATVMFGNPHAQNPSSQLSAQRVDEVREQILRFFNADPAEWQVVFTRSATGALKLVGETFPWSTGSLFRYLRENHNSVLGMREYALSHQGAFQAVDENLVSEWIGAPVPPYEDDGEELPSHHDHAPGECTGTNADGGCEVDFDEMSASMDEDREVEEVTYSLFAYPAEDNFAGVKYPLSWAKDIKKRSTANHKWMVLIDAAAYVPTQPMDLSKVAADFVDVAFYKMFGYPTGLGALLVRTEAVPLLKKVFWGGGSVALASSNDNFHVLKCNPSEMLEDGTVSFLDIISLKHGFGMIEKLGGIHRIQAHVATITEWLYGALIKIRHTNGKPLVRVFGKHGRMDHRKVQGGIVNFQLRSPSGQPLSYKEFEREAAAAGFHLRTGAECNPGACYAYLGISDEEIESLAGEKEGCEDDVEYVSVQRPASQQVHSRDSLRTLTQAQRLELNLPDPDANSKWVAAPLGSIRVSLGMMSTFEDVFALANFVSAYKDREATDAAVI